MVPVEDPALHVALGSLLDTCLRDNRQAWELHADGTYRQREPARGEPERATHRILQRDPWGQVADASTNGAARPAVDGVSAGG
jgi:polyphosphate kinase